MLLMVDLCVAWHLRRTSTFSLACAEVTWFDMAIAFKKKLGSQRWNPKRPWEYQSTVAVGGILVSNGCKLHGRVGVSKKN